MGTGSGLCSQCVESATEPRHLLFLVKGHHLLTNTPFSHYRNFIIPVPKDLTVDIGDGKYTTDNTYVYPSSLCKHEWNERFFSNEKMAQQGQYDLSVLFSYVSVKDSEN